MGVAVGCGPAWLSRADVERLAESSLSEEATLLKLLARLDLADANDRLSSSSCNLLLPKWGAAHCALMTSPGSASFALQS